MLQTAPNLFSYRKYWAECFGPAPFLPMSRAEMEQLGWDSCDIIIVVGDAYIDHPSFGMAVIGRMLEAQGFRVGIIAQPDWNTKEPFKALGKPNLFFGVSAGNMDSMINRYTADRRLRHDDAYTPGNVGGKRPDRAVLVYSQRCKEAYPEVPVVIGGIEASLRRLAHYDYWSDKVRRSVLFDAKADILLFGNAERAIVEVAHGFAEGKSIAEMQDIRGTAVIRKAPLPGWSGLDSSHLDKPARIDPLPNPYAMEPASAPLVIGGPVTAPEALPVAVLDSPKRKPWEKTYIQLPSYEQVIADKYLYAHTSRVFHLETNPFSARALVQHHGDRLIWVNPPAIPLTTEEMDGVFGLPYQRIPHPVYQGEKIPAYDMIKTSVNIMRGCFGGCTFCSITEHEGRVIQSRSEASVLREIEEIRDKVPGFTGVISDLGGPTANMYHLRCKDPRAEETCRRASCVYPDICPNMDTDHSPTISLYRKARELPGIKKILIASGVRYDLAVEDPRYVRELVKHHVGGYLKIAPEHTEEGPLSKMYKPGMGAYHKFKEMFERFSKEAGKEQYLIPYFIAAHPGTTDDDMVNLALWLKRHNFKLDQVQNFYPSPMAAATTLYHTEIDGLRKVTRDSERVIVAKGLRQRRLHKALLRYHDPAGWPMIREALMRMGLSRLIGRSQQHLIPPASAAEMRGELAAGTGRKPVKNGAPSQPAATRFAPFPKAGGKGKSAVSAGGSRSDAKPALTTGKGGQRADKGTGKNHVKGRS
ncbi:MAG: YgiQ family radical SAM protein [Gammaproteobacteria bacterium]|nr:YgiQ family radical SAM protein [Gammaproteobacteria bacterium]